MSRRGINFDGSEGALDFFSTKQGKNIFRASVCDKVSFQDWFPKKREPVLKQYGLAFKKKCTHTVAKCSITRQIIITKGIVHPSKLGYGLNLVTYAREENLPAIKDDGKSRLIVRGSK